MELKAKQKPLTLCVYLPVIFHLFRRSPSSLQIWACTSHLFHNRWKVSGSKAVLLRSQICSPLRVFRAKAACPSYRRDMICKGGAKL